MTPSSPAPPCPERRAAGFSLIEVLIAMALLLLIVIGLLPLFTRSMLNNVQGDESTRVNNIAVDDFERLLSLPFDSLPMTVPGGNTVVTEDQALLLEANEWHDPATIPSGDQARFLRTTDVRQYNVDDLLDNGTLDNPLPGGWTPSQVHIKVVDVQIANPRMADAPPYRVRVVQAY